VPPGSVKPPSSICELLFTKNPLKADDAGLVGLVVYIGGYNS